MALPHLAIALRQRKAGVHLAFALSALAVAWMAAAELSAFHATTIQESGRALQLGHIPTYVMMVTIVAFVALYFGTARLWLGISACLLRLVCLVANFAYPPNLNFREITGLRSFVFLGDTITMPTGTRSLWVIPADISSLLLLIYVADASWKLWKRGGSEQKRRALVIGGSIIFFVLAAQSVAILVNSGTIQFPYFVSIPFTMIVAAMGFELSYDIVRSAQLSSALQASDERMKLAAESARLCLWEWDTERDELWMMEEGRALLGFEPDAQVTFAALLEKVHPEDRYLRETAIRQALETGGSYETEYRLLAPDGTLRWIAARGRCAKSQGAGSAKRILGVSIDITGQKRTDAEARQQREELGHLSRVALVGEMAASLAHELNQPLTAMVANAGAAQRFLARGNLDIEEFKELLADISSDGRRAGEVIRGIKGMVRKVEGERKELFLNQVITDVLRLVRSDALAHGCTLHPKLAPELPAIMGDAVQLQQVLLNLMLNAFDAMSDSGQQPRDLEIESRMIDSDWVEVSVRDSGPGLPTGDPMRVFDRFFSTKQDGMGMGLAIARSIIESHSGTLAAENHEGGGARFWFRLPAQAVATGGASA